MKLEQFITDLTNEYIPLYRTACESYWDFTTTGKKEAMEQSMQADKAILAMFADSNRFETLKKLIDIDTSASIETKRMAHLLLLDFTGSAFTQEEIEETVKREKEIENDFTNFRAIVNGEKRSENWLREQLKKSDNAQFRKDVWEASKQIGSITGPKIKELVKVRNAIAQRLGYSDAWTMRIVLQELDPLQLTKLLEDVYSSTETNWKKFKHHLEQKLVAKFHINIDELRPWHYGDPFFQEAPEPEVSIQMYFENANLEELTRNFYHSIGLPIDSILEKSDLYEREGKQQHAYCMSVDHADDIRILCNIKPTDYWMSTMLHEFGHGVYDAYIDRSLPFLIRTPAHTLTTEAIAMLMERNVKSPAWLISYLGVPQDMAIEAGDKFKKNLAEKHLIMARWCLVMVNFERKMYQDPEQDLDTLWWDLVEKYQEIHRPENRSNSDWAAKIHLGCSPVYYQNYLLGDLMASQIQATIKQKVLASEDNVEFAYVTSPHVGKYLRDKIFSFGKSLYWNRLIKEATGNELSEFEFSKECEWNT